MPPLRSRILLVDDDPGVRFGVRDYLETKGYQVSEAGGCVEAEVAFRAARADVVLADYQLPDGTALDLLPRLRRLDATLPVVLLTGHASIDLAVRAMQEGADHFLTKPVALPALAVVFERLIEQRRNRQRALAGEARQARETPDPFVGTSDAVRALEGQARKAADAERPVWIRGETGSGKGLLARWLHDNGPRAAEALVDLNCAALSRELLESELFGHEKGAFTGAVATKAGLLEIAHNGTLFLDEIGDMELSLQPKLLKVLEEQRFRRVGDVKDRQVDVRLIAATHQDLGALVRDKRFRSDLYFRISTLLLTVPPLRERTEDIAPVARALLDRLAADLGRARIELAADAVRALEGYPWPGNVRELRNVLERAVLLSEREALTRADLLFDGAGTAGPPPDDATAGMTLDEIERFHIERVLARAGGRVDDAARQLGIPRSTLYHKIKTLGLGGAGRG